MPSSTGSHTPRVRNNSRRRKRGDKEVLVHSSLPPQVDGQIRCFLVVKLKTVTWKISKHPDEVFLRVLWWGETPEATAIFSPTEQKVLARYPVRSGPKQMAAYLTDASTLHVDVLRGGDMSVIGKVQIYGLGSLAAGKPLAGPYPIFSTKSEIIGHVDVSISMKALHAFDDSGSSSLVPTTDLDNTDMQGTQPVVTHHDKLDSKIGTPSAYSSMMSHNKFQADKSLSVTGRALSPKKLTQDFSSVNSLVSQSPSDGNRSIDLISDLLEKGQRLRSAMITSSVDKEVELTSDIPKQSQFPHSRKALASLTNRTSPNKRRNKELNTVDLIIGSGTSRNKAVYISDDCPAELSLSDDFDPEYSDFEDPAHDQEILDLLFYKNSTKSNKQVTDTGTLTDLPDQAKSSKQGADYKVRQSVSSSHAASAVAAENQPPDVLLSRRSSVDEPGNVRPPSRPLSASPSPRLDTMLPSPRIDTSPARSLPGNQSDSGASRVSFDMTASDDEDTRSAAEGLSVEQLTLLARVSVARVHIDKLCLKERPNTPVEKKTYKGRPPPAKPAKYGTYFVEYQFPVVAASRDNSERNTSATETVRAVSKKVDKSGVVSWSHHTVFPVFFDGQTVESWWNSMLVLKIHHREPSSRTAVLIGSCSVQMKKLLQSLTFGLDVELQVTKHQKRSTGATKKRRRRRRADIIGLMTLNIQLDSDSPSFATALRELQISKARKQHPLLKPKPETPIAVPTTPELVRQTGPVKTTLYAAQSHQPAQASTSVQHVDLMLHMLLHISDTRGLMTSSTQGQTILSGPSLSTYIVCRLFWSGDKLRSEVCWSTATPNYRINESIPLHITQEVLKHMSNNYMIVEVWEKKATAQKDQLIGYAKLPLNSLYMSYKEPRIAQVLMKSQYPVIAVDSYLPITNPLSGKGQGELKVLLALGTQQQIMSLDTLKVISTATQIEEQNQRQMSQPAQPHQSLHQHLAYIPAEGDEGQITITSNEHRFDIKVVAVRDLITEESMYLGEADCFVQYHFPAQNHLSSDLSMKSFRSPTTLCTDNITFDDHHCHLITVSRDSNLQTLLASVFGASYGSAVPFELWCRFYHPNTRDQLMARSLLPLSKLLALITMSNGRSGETVSCHSYSLPMMPTEDNNKTGTVGVMDISVRYTHKIPQKAQHARQQPEAGLHNLGQVTLRVTVESVSGLKSAALALIRKHPCLDYYSTLGVNFYLKLMLSFQGPSDIRVSDTEPRIFYMEEFGFRTQFSLPLILNNNTSLAQCLQTGYLIAQVWHQSLKDSALDDCPGIPQSTDIQLGVCSVPLSNLLSHKTGIRGWYPVNSPPELYTTTQSHDPMMGALRLQLRLGASNDISHIIDSASKIGYQVPSPGIDTTDTVYDELSEISFEVDWFSLPARLILRSDEENLPLHAACYIKSAFYNNDVCYSVALPLTDKGDNFEGRCEVKLKFLQTISTAFLWYLFDQQLELELWLSNNSNTCIGEEITPSSSDKYLGTAYIPLEELSKRRQCTHSDVYPIYKTTSDRMGRSLIQVHSSRKPHVEPEQHVMKTHRVKRTDETNVTQLDDLDSSALSELDSLDENTIEATIGIDEANRVTIGQHNGTRLYVTYSLNGKEHKTSGVKASNKPCWQYEKCVRLDVLSIQQSKHLVLKLWSKSDNGGSQVLGFTTIDLRPLLAGMPNLSGWYNIVDFTGLCQGQIKCGVTPITPVGKRDDVKEFCSPRNPTPPQFKKKAAENRHRKSSPNRYITHSGYSEFPSHISRFNEQRVHFNHSLVASATPFDLLNKQLSELDTITNNLRKRLYRPSRGSSQHEHVESISQGQLPHPPLTESPPSDAAAPASGQRLMSTINQVHDNMLELVKHGVVNPQQILHSTLEKPDSSLPPVNSRQQAPADDVMMSSQAPADGVMMTSQEPADNDIMRPKATVSDQQLQSQEHLERDVSTSVYDGTFHQAPVDEQLQIDVSSSVSYGSKLSQSTRLSLKFDAQQDMENKDDDCSDVGGGWVSPFTPRTQATYSMTSDDEQFSPPIYMSKQHPSGAVHREDTMTLEGEESDWTDQMKRIPSESSEPKLSQEPEHSHPPGQDLTIPQPGVKSQTSSDTLSQGSYNIDTPPMISSAPPLGMQTGAFDFDVAAHQSSNALREATSSHKDDRTMTAEKSDTERHQVISDDEDGQQVLPEYQVISDKGEQVPSDHEDQVLSDREAQVLSGHEENVPFDDSDGEYEEEEAVSRTINEDLSPTTLDDVSNQEFGSFHDTTIELNESSMPSAPAAPHHNIMDTKPKQTESTTHKKLSITDKGQPTNQHTEATGSDDTDSGYPITQQRSVTAGNTIVTLEPHRSDSIDTVQAEAAAGEASTPVKVPTGSQGNPVTLPSFFPTKEELEAKLLAAKRQPAKVVDRFIRRKPITEIARDFPASGDRARRVADIFSTRFNNSTHQ